MRAVLPSFLESQPSRADRARARLLQAGLEIFGDKGPRGATVREIARRAGQNVAAIAYYFGGKEQLYLAVLEGIVRELRRRMAGVFAAMEKLQAHPPDPDSARRLLKEFLREVYLRVLSRDEAVAMARLLVREQLRPSSGFDVIYERGFLPLHTGLTRLVGHALGLDPEQPDTLLRTHMLMGQVYFFAMTREAILRRLGWETLEGAHADRVVGLLDQHLDVLIAGLRRAGVGAKPAPSNRGARARKS
jgi:AcrR family transcriptional regulator